MYAVGARTSELPIPNVVPNGVACGDITVTCPNTRRPRRRMFRATGHGLIPGYAPICLDSADPDTVRAGFYKRLCRDLPKPKPGKLEKLRAFVKDWCCANLSRVKELGFEEWLATTTYTEARKAELRLAHDELRGGRPTSKDLHRAASFVKTEAYAKYCHCRLINSRNDKVKAWFGPKCKAIEQVVYKLKEFIKHVPTADRPCLIAGLRRALRRYFLTDYTAFESHFTDEIMDCVECEVYRYCLDTDVDVELICKMLTGFNVLKTRSGVRCRVKARRLSGDMCTSLGNGLTNLLLTLFIVSEQGGEVEGFVEGDDGVFSSTVPLTAEMYLELGFSIKIAEVEDPCTSIPVVRTGSRFGESVGAFCGVVSAGQDALRDPRTFMLKFGWTSSMINARQGIMDGLARAKALSALSENPQCPIIGALARRVEEDTRGATARFELDYYHTKVVVDDGSLANIPFKPTQASRDLVSVLYGIDPKLQILAEDMIAKGNFNIASLVPPTSDAAHYYARYVEV